MDAADSKAAADYEAMSCLQVKIAHIKQTEISMFETNVPEAKRLQVNLLEGWFRMRFRMWWVRAVNKLEIGFPIVAEDDFEVSLGIPGKICGWAKIRKPITKTSRLMPYFKQCLSLLIINCKHIAQHDNIMRVQAKHFHGFSGDMSCNFSWSKCSRSSRLQILLTSHVTKPFLPHFSPCWLSKHAKWLRMHQATWKHERSDMRNSVQWWKSHHKTPR